MSKNYVAKGKKYEFPNGGSIIKIGIKPSELVQYANEKGYVNLVIGGLKDKDKYGNDHTVWIDDWKPQPKEDTTIKTEEEAF